MNACRPWRTAPVLGVLLATSLVACGRPSGTTDAKPAPTAAVRCLTAAGLPSIVHRRPRVWLGTGRATGAAVLVLGYQYPGQAEAVARGHPELATRAAGRFAVQATRRGDRRDARHVAVVAACLADEP